MLKDIIIQRRTSGTAQNDLLDMLLNSRYEDTGQGMSEEQLINELLIFLFAGHETTGNTLSWMLYLIASDKKVLEKLNSTIEKINILDSPRDSYINAIINESMRLYPTAWLGERVAIKDDQFGSFSFPGGTSVYTYFYGMHRHSEYWKDASKFDPERFLTPEGSINKSVKNYFPFGAGPRMCIGNNFAMAEMAFVVYAIFKTFQIRSTQSIPPALALLTLRPREVILNIKRV